MISNIIDLYNRWISLAQLGAKHVSESRRRCHENYFMTVKNTTFDSELYIAEFWIVDEFRINSRTTRQGRVSDWFYLFPSKAGTEYISQKQRGTFFLQSATGKFNVEKLFEQI